MGGNPSSKDLKLRCSYHKDHDHKTKNCKTLKQFLERLVDQGHLVEYIKPTGKAMAQDNDNEQKVVLAKGRLPIIDAIHAWHN